MGLPLSASVWLGCCHELQGGSGGRRLVALTVSATRGAACCCSSLCRASAALHRASSVKQARRARCMAGPEAMLGGTKPVSSQSQQADVCTLCVV